MNDAEKQLVEQLAVDAEINGALAKYGAKSLKLLASHIRSHVKVELAFGAPIVKVVGDDGKLQTVDAFVSTLKADPEFRGTFVETPVVTPTTADGVPTVRESDFQKALNSNPAMLRKIADGLVVVVADNPDEELVLGENEIHVRNQAAINANLEKIASGEVTLVE